MMIEEQTSLKITLTETESCLLCEASAVLNKIIDAVKGQKGKKKAFYTLSKFSKMYSKAIPLEDIAFILDTISCQEIYYQ